MPFWVRPACHWTTHGKQQQLGNTISSSNLVTSDMMASLSAHTRETLNSLEKAFAINKQLVQSNNAGLANAGTAKLREASLQLLMLGDGPNSIFATRRKELDAIEAGQAIAIA
jgi:hypothetical protein